MRLYLLMEVAVCTAACAAAYMVTHSPTNPCVRTPICVQCKESFVESGEKKCKLFYTINVVTGERHYTTCYRARILESMCGKEGRFFFHRLNETASES